ncbi:sigma-70 family RNA polymerase sigma factor [Mucilaginibacter sp.]
MSFNKNKETADDLNPLGWVQAHADYLYAYACTRLNDEEQARDAVQETFLAALEAMGNYQYKSSERTWLTAILKHKIIDVYRKKSASLIKGAVAAIDLQEPQDFFDKADGHWSQLHRPQPFNYIEDDALTRKEFTLVLQRCLQKLPALWAATFTLKHIDDEETEIICRELKLTAANFWVIMHRAKLNLRACLQKNWN